MSEATSGRERLRELDQRWAELRATATRLCTEAANVATSTLSRARSLRGRAAWLTRMANYWDAKIRPEVIEALADEASA